MRGAKSDGLRHSRLRTILPGLFSINVNSSALLAVVKCTNADTLDSN